MTDSDGVQVSGVVSAGDAAALKQAGFMAVQGYHGPLVVRVSNIVSVQPPHDPLLTGVSINTIAGTIVVREPYEAVLARLRAHYE